MSQPVLITEGLGKRYELGEFDLYGGVGDRLAAVLRRRRQRAERPGREELWALRDLNFEAAGGETLGVIGPNGAGKSTLLKILAGITEPTKGRALVRGRVGALLEVGTAFTPDLTGRENIEINGALLGMRRREVRERFDDIVEFSGVGRFLDTPLKRYSSGMQMRLAFAVAAHLEPEIVVVDEVLAVGDAEFQQRCIGKMDDLGRHGRTVLFVSHDLGAVARLCHRVLWLEGGRCRRDGPAAEVISEYLNAGAETSAARIVVPERPGEQAQILELAVVDATGAPAPSIRRDEPLRVMVRVVTRDPVPGLDVRIWVHDAEGTRLLDEALSDVPSREGLLASPGERELAVEIPPVLLPGDYVVGVTLEADGAPVHDDERVRIRTLALPEDRMAAARRHRVVAPATRWDLRRAPVDV